MLNKSWPLTRPRTAVALVKSPLHEIVGQPFFASSAPIQIYPTDGVQRLWCSNLRKGNHRRLEDAVIAALQDRSNNVEQPLVVRSNSHKCRNSLAKPLRTSILPRRSGCRDEVVDRINRLAAQLPDADRCPIGDCGLWVVQRPAQGRQISDIWLVLAVGIKASIRWKRLQSSNTAASSDDDGFWGLGLRISINRSFVLRFDAKHGTGPCISRTAWDQQSIHEL